MKKRFISVFTAVVIIFGLAVIPASANGYTTADALEILRHTAGAVTLNPEQQTKFDLNKDGRITTADALFALQITAGVARAPEDTAPGNPVITNTSMRNISTMELVRDMGLGINLGNTFEACGSWITGNTVTAFETAWGSPVITRPMIDGYKAAGFNTVRIPVAWSNMMSADYTISPAYLARVEEVLNYVLDNGMYAIINIHWDGGWWEKFPAEYDESMRRYRRMWTQISEYFADYSDYLLFESLNEEGGWNSLWEPWTPSNDGKKRSYEILNNINQAFVDIIRASGGNNAYRHLLIAGYQTDIDRTVDPLFVMPKDPRNRCAVKVHYYDPFGFTHLKKDESWEPLRMTWGSAEEIAHLNRQMDKLKTTFIDNGIPVVIGEYGFASGLPRDLAQIRNFTLTVTEAMYSRGMCPVLWCVQLSDDQFMFYYDRHQKRLVDPLLEEGLKSMKR